MSHHRSQFLRQPQYQQRTPEPKIPEPVVGMVVCYGYLWAREHNKGEVDGAKNRPCAILAVKEEKDGSKTVYVAPITHTAPYHPQDAILLPQETKTRLGLDTLNSWMMCSEVNKFTWPGLDLRPIHRNGQRTFSSGVLPAAVSRQAQSLLQEINKHQHLKIVPRTAAPTTSTR